MCFGHNIFIILLYSTIILHYYKLISTYNRFNWLVFKLKGNKIFCGLLEVFFFLLKCVMKIFKLIFYIFITCLKIKYCKNPLWNNKTQIILSLYQHNITITIFPYIKDLLTYHSSTLWISYHVDIDVHRVLKLRFYQT